MTDPDILSRREMEERLSGDHTTAYERQALEGMRWLGELLEPFACRGNCNGCPGAPAMNTREACEARMWLGGKDDG